MGKKLWVELFESGRDANENAFVFWVDEESLGNALKCEPEGRNVFILYGWYEHGRYNCKKIHAIEREEDDREFAFLYDLPNADVLLKQLKED